VTHSNYSDSAITIADGVQDSVVANPEAILVTGAELLCAFGSGNVFKRKNSSADAAMYCRGEFIHLLLSRMEDPDFIFHPFRSLTF